MHEQNGFRENRCRRNGWLPLRCWLRANYPLNRKQWCGRVARSNMRTRHWNRAGALHIVANWNLLPAWLVSASQNGTRAFCTTRVAYLRPPCAELRHFRQLPAESCAVAKLVKQPLLHTRRRWELIHVARNWFSRNERLSQNFPLSRLLLPCINGHKFRVRNVITRIFVAGRIVCA